MGNIVDLSKLFHRSKDRIQEYGEVFTPEKFADGMLNLLSRGKKNFWGNEDLIFFEPACGHGNIIIPIYKRRLSAVLKKAESEGFDNPAFYAVANALNTLWAIDIDSENIKNCRTRLLKVSLEFLKEMTNVKSDYLLIKANQEFFAHILCALRWQVSENEALSALSKPESAHVKAKQTRVGDKWFSEYGHKELNFDLSWARHYHLSLKNKTVLLDFQRSENFISGVLNSSVKGYPDFDFAKFILRDSQSSRSLSRDEIAMGV